MWFPVVLSFAFYHNVFQHQPNQKQQLEELEAAHENYVQMLLNTQATPTKCRAAAAAAVAGRG